MRLRLEHMGAEPDGSIRIDAWLEDDEDDDGPRYVGELSLSEGEWAKVYTAVFEAGEQIEVEVSGAG